MIVAFAALFVALALSSFGLYELQLPAALRNRLGSLSDQQRGGSWAGVAVMGALSALIVGPCVAPPLAAAVLYIGQTQDPAFGGAALFLLAMGMGVPLIAFGVAAGKGLPTSGPWMVAVQRVFGFVFLGLAVWMLSRVLPAPVALALWGAWLLGGGGHAGADAPASRPCATASARWAGPPRCCSAWSARRRWSARLAGSRDPLQPLAGLRGWRARHAAANCRSARSSRWPTSTARSPPRRPPGQPLMLDFYADWCVACKEMEKYTFPDPLVHAALAGFVLLKADVTANDDLDQALMQRLGIIGPPATLFYVDGGERRDLRLFGFEKAALFVATCQAAPADPQAAADGDGVDHQDPAGRRGRRHAGRRRRAVAQRARPAAAAPMLRSALGSGCCRPAPPRPRPRHRPVSRSPNAAQPMPALTLPTLGRQAHCALPAAYAGRPDC